MKRLLDIEEQRLAMGLIKQLEGLSIAQARWVLEVAADLINNTHRVDISTNDFTNYDEDVAKHLGASS